MTARCTRCGGPLDKTLADTGFRTHPCCDPGEVSAQWPPETAGDPATLPVRRVDSRRQRYGDQEMRS